MANVNDLAAFILRKKGSMPAMKLQKLVYYCQAWSLVWESKPLFPERIEAWVNGPVVPDLYKQHRGMFEVFNWTGNPDALAPSEISTVEAVLAFYGDKPPQWLSDLTHAERPWQDARRGMAPLERGSNEITWASMAEYYGSLAR